MTPEIKDAIKRKLQADIAEFLMANGALENDVMWHMHDDDLSPLQPLIGDHITFSISGVIRLEDFAVLHPELLKEQT